MVVTTANTMVGVIAVATAVSHQPWMLGKSLVAGVLVVSAYLLLAVVGGGLKIGDVHLAGLLGLALGTVGWTAVLLGAVVPYLLAIPNAAAQLRRSDYPDD